MDNLLGGGAFLLLMVAQVLAVVAVRARFGESYGEIIGPTSSGNHRPRTTPDYHHGLANGAAPVASTTA